MKTKLVPDKCFVLLLVSIKWNYDEHNCRNTLIQEFRIVITNTLIYFHYLHCTLLFISLLSYLGRCTLRSSSSDTLWKFVGTHGLVDKSFVSTASFGTHGQVDKALDEAIPSFDRTSCRFNTWSEQRGT